MRVAFAGLFTACDREGRFEWLPKTLKLDCLPHDELDFSRVLDALFTRGFISKYTSENKIYGFIPSWSKHQVINNKESASKIPSPHEELSQIWVPTREARVKHASTTRADLFQGEGKGREWEGKGREGEKHSPVEPQKKITPSTNLEVEEIFEYWQLKLNHPNAKLDSKRLRAIKARLLDGYTVGEICKAIDGCFIDPFSQGKNDRNTVFDDIELICRTAVKLDSFIKMAERGVILNSDMSENRRKTLENMNLFLEKHS